jgi:hypothetical protein
LVGVDGNSVDHHLIMKKMLVRKGYESNEEQNVLYELTSKVALSRGNYEGKQFYSLISFLLNLQIRKKF